MVYNNIAWFYATANDKLYQDGEKKCRMQLKVVG